MAHLLHQEQTPNLLGRFLWFCTGSDVLLPYNQIHVRFVNMRNSPMWPKAQTYFNLLTLPQNYRLLVHLSDNNDFYLCNPLQVLTLMSPISSAISAKWSANICATVSWLLMILPLTFKLISDPLTSFLDLRKGLKNRNKACFRHQCLSRP